MALKDSYNTGDNGEQIMFGANWEAQTFTASSNYGIASVKLKLYKFLTPGIITVSIRATTGGQPSGGDKTSGTTNGNTLTAISPGEWREITFSSPYSLTSGLKYAIVVRPAGNALYWRNASPGGYANGAREESSDSGASWTTRTTSDFMFETYSAAFLTPVDMITYRRLVAAASNTIWYEDI